jgi:hypothetical protein
MVLKLLCYCFKSSNNKNKNRERKRRRSTSSTIKIIKNLSPKVDIKKLKKTNSLNEKINKKINNDNDNDDDGDEFVAFSHENRQKYVLSTNNNNNNNNKSRNLNMNDFKRIFRINSEIKQIKVKHKNTFLILLSFRNKEILSLKYNSCGNFISFSAFC